MDPLAWLILAGVAVWAWTKYSASLQLSFQPRGISFDGGNIVVKLGIINQSTSPISFNSFNGQLIINGTAVGLIQDFTAQTIVANGETDLNLIFQPYAGQLLSSIENFLQNPTGQQIQITGQLVAENIPISINQSFNTASLPI